MEAGNNCIACALLDLNGIPYTKKVFDKDNSFPRKSCSKFYVDLARRQVDAYVGLSRYPRATISMRTGYSDLTNTVLGGGFNFFYFHLYLGNDPI